MVKAKGNLENFLKTNFSGKVSLCFFADFFLSLTFHAAKPKGKLSAIRQVFMYYNLIKWGQYCFRFRF